MNEKAVEKKLASLRKRSDRVMDRLREFEAETQGNMETIRLLLDNLQTIIDESEEE